MRSYCWGAGSVVLLAVSAAGSNATRPNVLMILVDDLGYGDLSVPPFTGHGLLTPELELMARESTILTNFHATAPICTPSRASILTGLFPWRLGIYSIYGTGPQADEHLAVTPNAPMAFLEAGYHTAHVGKWHLGGMRPKDIEMRASRRCGAADPGPTQHGFAEYVSMAEGPGSARLASLLPAKQLYHSGAKHLVRNDRPLPQPAGSPVPILTDRQTDEAIRIMTESSKRGQPFYMHVWYDAPHGPWEVIAPYNKLYKEKQWEGTRNFPYATMVSSVDANIGRLRRALDALGIAENTLVVFLSDNGPEELAGSAGPFKGRKRSLQEGGIRVPCMWQWKGKIAENRRLNTFSLATDLFPTFMAAAGITSPGGGSPSPPLYRLDGSSILDLLLLPPLQTRPAAETAQRLSQRTALWHKDIEGRMAAAWSHGYKLVVHGGPSTNTGPGIKPDKLVLTDATPIELFDMTVDEREGRTLHFLAGPRGQQTNSTSHQALFGGGGGGGVAGEGTSRSDPRHVGRVRQHMLDKLALFVAQGNRPYSQHKETKLCSAPRPKDVAALPWGATVAVAPEF